LLIKNKKKKQKKRLPTVDEFLQYKPIRLDFQWSTNKDELVEIKVPKFTSKFGKSFIKIIRKENIFTANMDKIGSLVWKNCNGKNTVKQILEIVKKEFPEEENLEKRLFFFFQQMRNLHYIHY
jgi:hypothetical protein